MEGFYLKIYPLNGGLVDFLKNHLVGHPIKSIQQLKNWLMDWIQNRMC